MTETSTLSLRNLGRAVREALAHPPGDGAPPTSLDLSGLVMDPPRMGECTLVEGATLAAIPVGDEPLVALRRSSTAPNAATSSITRAQSPSSRVGRRRSFAGVWPVA